MAVTRRAILLVTILSLSLALSARAHEHHMEDVGPYEQNFLNEEPIDSTLKWHIGIQTLCWGFLFPAGMIMGLQKSRYHVPLQTLTILLSLGGNTLGHSHKGRMFHYTAHAGAAFYMWWYMILQASFGVFLKLHVLEGTKLRNGVKKAHKWVGMTFPIFGWVQMLFGAIASLGFCFGEHFGQCLAHEIMGSAFILYAFIVLLMLRLGASFLQQHKFSQEFLDSTIIGIWGIVNTFTEHNFFGENSGWSHKDMQHVSLGVLWWCGGALGMWLSWGGKRSVVPALIIAMTGLAMANHGQHLEFSTTVHKAFGYSLIAAGLTRLVEICFVLNDRPTPSTTLENSKVRAFQHLPPFLLVLSGLTFMSATEEQMQWVAGSGMDATTYINILFSGSFIIYLVGVGMLDFYEFERGRREKRDQIREGVRNGLGDEEVGRGRGWFEGVWLRFPGQGRSLNETRRNTAEYEAMPLTSGRESVDVRFGGGSGSGSGSIESVEMGTRRNHHREESGETVFELGDEEEEDDGGDGYWKESERERRSARV